MMEYRFRPLDHWPERRTEIRRPRRTFSAAWSSTLDLLGRELDHLDAQRVILAADFRERDIRLDGMPRSDARQPAFPGVRVMFESKHGPLDYATDSCTFWQHNVRSIALGLEALRAVDRYGVTKRGEQYRGWRAIETGSVPPPPEDPLVTIAHLSAEKEGNFRLSQDLDRYRANPAEIRRDYRKALKLHHPDVGGDPAKFEQLQKAAQAMEQLGRWP